MKKAKSKIYLVWLSVLLLPVSFSSASSQKGSGAEQITINFVDVEIASLIKVMSEITGKNFIYDSGIKGRVTIIAPAKLTREDAFRLFVSALALKNFAVLPAGRAYKIVPATQARQSPARIVTEPGVTGVDETFIVRLIPLRFISTQEALPFVQPYVSRNGHVSAFGSRNALLVVDTTMNVEKIVSILDSVDTGPEYEEPEIVYLRYAQAGSMSKIVKEDLERRERIVARPGAKTGSGQKGSVIYDERLNALILSGPSSEREYLKRLIALLDVPPPEGVSKINVYYLENADAEEIARVLEGLVEMPQLKSEAAPGPMQELTGRVAVMPDRATNSLIILASPQDYQTIVQVVRKLDRRPKQVFVEAMITEVSIDKAIELGNRWRLTAEKGGEPVVIGGVGTVDSSAIQSIISGLAGFSIGGMGNFITVPVTGTDGSVYELTAPGFAALFSLSQFRDVVNVLSTPHILTSDNTEAEIIVGENVPFLSKLERETTTTGQPLIQSIERKDVGITLRIKPKISEGDYVKLDIYQEISAVSPTTVTGATDLITTKRSASTNVVVKNNQTVVIGGLIQDRETDNITKVPLLGDLPILGWLFKYRTKQKQKTNILVFITPHIVEDFEGLDDIRKSKEKEYIKGGGKASTRDTDDSGP